MRIINLQGNLGKQEWAADLAEGPEVTHRISSTRNDQGDHQITVRDLSGELIAQVASKGAVGLETVEQWVADRVLTYQENNSDREEGLRIDLSALTVPDYSEKVLDKAEAVLKYGRIRKIKGVRAAEVFSLNGSSRYVVTAITAVGGEVLGMTCSCPNGYRGGYRARCYHSAAFQKVLEDQLEIPVVEVQRSEGEKK